MKTLIDMLTNHWGWGLLTIAVLAWYCTITIFVAYKGARDIKEMLRNLARDHAKNEVHK